jgi:peptidoglycan/LPS O-acetylase OafA/YrhL
MAALRSFASNLKIGPAITSHRTARKRRFVIIDGLRGLASLWVVLLHLEQALEEPLSHLIPYIFLKIMQLGALGVEVFFVLSGFVIAHAVGTHPITARFIGRFALRRSLRLDPPYWTAMAVMLGGYCITRGIRAVYEYWGWRALLANMFYLHDIFSVRPAGDAQYWRVLQVSWTLCLEIQFYLVFVCLLGIAQRVSRHFEHSTYLVVFAPLALCSVYRWYFRSDWSFFGMWHMFFLGAYLYSAIFQQADKRWFFVFTGLIGICAVGTFNAEGCVALATATLIYVAASRDHLYDWLANRTLQYLGRISYSLYLIHAVVGGYTIWYLRQYFASTAAAIPVFAAGLFGSIASADLLFRLVERPGIAVARRIELVRESGDDVRSTTLCMRQP